MIELREKKTFFFFNKIEKIFTVFVNLRFEVKESEEKLPKIFTGEKPSYMECNFSTGTRPTSTIYHCVIMCLNCALTECIDRSLKMTCK